MDLYKAIRTLHDEKKRLDKLIESLELMQARGMAAEGLRITPRRGRRKMSLAERQQVSERMRRYWASRRQDMAAGASAGVGQAIAEPTCVI